MNNQDISIIAVTSTGVKEVAIYCRVSTEDQEREGTSLDTQRAACLEFCQKHNYTVTHQFIETASGLSLDRPKLDELRRLIRNGDIAGVVIYCLDRLSRDPTHGVILTQELEKHSITLEAVTEDVDNSELGKLISYIRGYAAKLEAEKIRVRTMRGTKARVMDKKLPVTHRKPYGYNWAGERQLEPNSDYDTVKLIFALSLDGKSYDYIIAELKKRAIKSPSGLDEWNKHTISSIIRNPVYCGKYYAFKSEVITPKKRNGTTYGKTSVKRLPIDQWHYIPEIEVINPPITIEQRALLLDQLKARQKLASRNAKREYLLRGMVFCETHKGKNGGPRIYHGQPHRGSWRYACPVGGCDSQYLDGEALEHVVKYDIVGPIFAMRDDEFYSQVMGKETRNKIEQGLKTDLKKLELELEQVIAKTAALEDERISGKFTDQDVYDRLRLKYQARREQIKARQDLALGQLAQLGRERQALESWQEIKAKFLGRLQFEPQTLFEEHSAGEIIEGKELTFNEWRELLTTLNFKIHVFPQDTIHDKDKQYFHIPLVRIKAELKVKEDPKSLPQYIHQLRNDKSVNVVVTYSLPIKPDYVNTALHSPVPG